MPARTGHTTYVPGKGAYTSKGKKKTFTGTGAPPPGTTKVAPPTVEEATVRTVSAPSGPSKQEARAQRAATRQRHLVTKYVTKAYSHKLKQKGVPTIEIGTRIEKAKSELEKDRERLLSHPAVQSANAEGKVVSAKGLHQIQTRKAQERAIVGPSGLKHSEKFGTAPRSLRLSDPQFRKLERIEGTPQGTVGKTRAKVIADLHAKTEPSALEVLSIASLGIPGVGVGADAARLAELGARAIPALATKEGAQQVATSLAAKGATKALEAGRAAKTAAQAVKGAPRAAKELPSALRVGAKTAPASAKAAARGLPKAATAAVKATPKALGRGALKGGEKTTHALGVLGPLAVTQNAGIHTQPGKIADALLRGTEKAITEHPVETAETTIRAAPAAITAPAALLYTAGEIPFEGTKPFTKTASMQFEGLKQIGRDLLSGNPARVQKAVQKEGALTLLTPLPALTRTKGYEALRADVRAAAAGARRASGRGRIAPKGVEQNLLGFTERRAARKRVAVLHARTTNPHRISEARHTGAVLHGTLKRPTLSKAPEGSHVALQTLLEYGIRSPEGVKLVRKDGPRSEPNIEGRVNLDTALRYAEDNPGIFKDKAFLRALKRGERASKTTPTALEGMGEVARHRAQGELFGVLPPEKAVPLKARKYTSAKTRADAWKQLDQMESRLSQLKAKRRGKGPKGRLGPRRAQEIKALETRTAGLRRELDPFTRPSQKSLSGERRAWDEPLEKEYLAKVQKAQKGSPLVEPTWTHHATFAGTKMGIEGQALPATAGGKVYVRKGILAENDLVDRSLQAFVRGTIEMPRRRAAAAEFGREFASSEKLPYTLDGKVHYNVPDSETWAKITSPKTKENPDGGQYDPKTYGRFPLRQWGTAARDPLSTDAELSALLADAEAGRIRGHEPSLIVPREAIREFSEKVNPNPGTVTEFTSKWSRRASKAILATNPAWVIAQIPAEGIPLALAHPELLNPLKTGSILKDLREYRRTHPEEAAMLEGSAGASPQITAGSLRSPLDLEREAAFNPQPAMFAEGAKQMTRGPLGRAVASTAKLEPLGLFDVKRQNAYRSVLLAAEADKQFRGFTSGVRGYFRKSAKISEKFRGKSREEMWTWLSSTKEGKRELRKLADYVDNIQGNWTAFSRYERAFAPLTIFYPFLRYSLRWTLWTFPRTHPLTATIAYMLGQANANELEKVLGAKPASPIAYAYPVVKNAEGKSSVLPGGSRISPGQSALQQAAASQEAPQLLSAVNPILGAGLTALGGPGPFGQKPSGPAGWAAVDQLLSLPAPLRVLMSETGIHSEEAAAALGITRRQPESVIARAFKKLDPNKGKRSLLFPGIPQSGKDARMSNELSRALKLAEANSKAKQEDVAGDDSLTVQARRKEIAKMKKRSEAAKEEIDSVLKKLHLDKEDAAAYERWKEALYGGEKSGGYSGSGYESQGYEGGGYPGQGSKALKYKPPSGALDLSGLSKTLGSITSPLAALIGGTPAQAATRPLKPDKKTRVPRIEGIDVPGEATQFAQYLAKYTGLDPQFVGAWVKAEGGGAANGGQAGRNNWLGVGYPGAPTAFSQSPYFNGNAQQAAKATAEWMRGKIGHEYGYRASAGIQKIIPAARGRGPQAAVNALAASGWGTDVNSVVQNLAGVQASGKMLADAHTQGRRVFVRADAKGMVEWAHSLLGTQEGSPKQVKWAAESGVSPQEPWCSEFIAAGLARRGLPKPANPAYSGTWLTWKGGKHIGTDPAKAKPGDIVVFGSNPGATTHVGLYVGSGKMISGNWSDEVAAARVSEDSEPIAGIIRPRYKGGKIAVKAGVPLPGSVITPSGEVLAAPAAVPISAPSFEKKEATKNKGRTPVQKLRLLEQISEGNLTALGIPGFAKTGPAVSDLASLGRSLEAGRRELTQL